MGFFLCCLLAMFLQLGGMLDTGSLQTFGFGRMVQSQEVKRMALRSLCQGPTLAMYRKLYKLHSENTPEWNQLVVLVSDVKYSPFIIIIIIIVIIIIIIISCYSQRYRSLLVTTVFCGKFFQIPRASLRNSVAQCGKFSTYGNYFLWPPKPDQICSICRQ